MFKDLKPTILDPTRQQQFDAWIAQVDQFPEFIQEADKGILLHRDYSRVISEHRNDLKSDKAKYEILVQRLDEVGIRELVMNDWDAQSQQTTDATTETPEASINIVEDEVIDLSIETQDEIVVLGWDANPVTTINFEDIIK